MKDWEKGYLQVYTGNGKGKTTSAIGLAVRALGNNLSVFIGQFVKGMKYSEIFCLEKLNNNIKEKLIIKQFGRQCFINYEPDNEDFRLAKEGWNEIKEIIISGSFDVIIADELSIAVFYKLINLEDILYTIDNRKDTSELIITGRYMPKEIIDKADLVTEMNEIKHYYKKGIIARKGIES